MNVRRTAMGITIVATALLAGACSSQEATTAPVPIDTSGPHGSAPVVSDADRLGYELASPTVTKFHIEDSYGGERHGLLWLCHGSTAVYLYKTGVSSDVVAIPGSPECTE